MTPALVAELRRLAEAATSGPWRVNSRAVEGPEDDDGYSSVVAYVEDEHTDEWAANVRYLAAVSPDVVLGLLAALELARASGDRLAAAVPATAILSRSRRDTRLQRLSAI